MANDFQSAFLHGTSHLSPADISILNSMQDHLSLLDSEIAAVAPFNTTLAANSAIGDTTITVGSLPQGFAAGLGFVVIGAYTINAEARRVSSAAGNVLTLANSLSTTVSCTFTAATKRISATSETVSKALPGSVIKVTGTVSNNGTYTVADVTPPGFGVTLYDATYITVNESLIDEGPVSATIKVDLNRAHAIGDTVLWSTGANNVQYYGVKASGSSGDATNNRTGFQRCLDDVWWQKIWDVYVPGFMGGRIFIDKPLYMDEFTHLRGPHQKAAVISPSSAFPVWDWNVALLHTRRAGLINYKATGGNGRYYISGIGLDGQSLAYLKSPSFSYSNQVGTGYIASSTTFVITASMVTTSSGTNNRIVYRAVSGGTGGNSIRVAHVNDGPGTPLTISVSGNDITVHLATNGGGAVTSTANDVISAVNADANASALVAASLFLRDSGASSNGAGAAGTFALTALTAGAAPFVAGDVGRSLSVGFKDGARTITAVTNGYTVTVDSAFTYTQAGLKWAVSGSNGFLMCSNQTSVYEDMRLEGLPGACWIDSSSQEYTARNIMFIQSSIGAWLLKTQFTHWIDTNYEQICDASILLDAGFTVSSGNSWVNMHIEDSGNQPDHFRIIDDGATGYATINTILNPHVTIGIDSTFFNNKARIPSSFRISNARFSGPNAGPTIINDVARNQTLTLAQIFDADTNGAYLPDWISGLGLAGIAGEGNARAITYSASMTPDTKYRGPFTIVATNGTAFTISNPTNVYQKGQELVLDIKNSSGGAMGAITWGANFLLAGAFTNPANGKRRTIRFYWDGTNWIELNRAAADI